MHKDFIMKIIEEILLKKNNEIRIPYGHEVPSAVADFHANIDSIIDEWKNYAATNHAAGIPIDELSYEQKHLNEDKKWKAFFVFVFGEHTPEAVKKFPKTSTLAEKWKNEITLVFFSNLEPGKHIPPHKGNNHSVIRAQIGVDIEMPESTGLRVEDKLIQLRNRELFIFDDTFKHEAWNKGSGNRVVLIIDTRKKFPFFHNIINKYLLGRMKKTAYVQSALDKLKN